MTGNEIARDPNSINRIAFFKKRAKDFFADYENPTGSEDKLEICLIRDGYRAVSQAEEIINRLQADKEALIAGQETLQKALAEKNAEIERLEKAGEEAVSCFHRMESLYNIKRMELKVAKAEAIKEFAERLKEKFSGVSLCNNGFVNSTLDNIVKEMVGDTE